MIKYGSHSVAFQTAIQTCWAPTNPPPRIQHPKISGNSVRNPSITNNHIQVFSENSNNSVFWNGASLNYVLSLNGDAKRSFRDMIGGYKIAFKFMNSNSSLCQNPLKLRNFWTWTWNIFVIYSISEGRRNWTHFGAAFSIAPNFDNTLKCVISLWISSKCRLLQLGFCVQVWASGNGGWAQLQGTVKAVEWQRLHAHHLSLEFFDRLQTAGKNEINVRIVRINMRLMWLGIIRENGSLVQCMPEWDDDSPYPMQLNTELHRCLFQQVRIRLCVYFSHWLPVSIGKRAFYAVFQGWSQGMDVWTVENAVGGWSAVSMGWWISTVHWHYTSAVSGFSQVTWCEQSV